MKRIFNIALLLLVAVILSGCNLYESIYNPQKVSITFEIATDSEKCYEIAVVGGSTRSSALPGVFDKYSTAEFAVVEGLSRNDTKAYRAFKAAETPWHYARDIIFGEGVKCNIYERGGKPFIKLIYTFTQEDIQPNSIFLYENWTLEIDDRNEGLVGPIYTNNIRYIYTYKFTPPAAEE